MATVNWRAPALDTVLLRFTREEVEYIINYGRPFSPMPGWGAEVGKGPLSPQQVTNLVDYLASIQLTPEEAPARGRGGAGHRPGPHRGGRLRRGDRRRHRARSTTTTRPPAQAPFNLEAAGGAFACARCHTRGWSIIQEGEDAISPPDADLSDFAGFPDGSGAFGPNLTRRPDPPAVRHLRGAGRVHHRRQHRRRGLRQQRHRQRPHAGLRRQPQHPEVEGDGMMHARDDRRDRPLRGAACRAVDTPDPPAAPSVAELTAVDEEG